MAYFPLFVNLNNKDVLVVGGGEIACRKVEALLPFGPKVTVITKVANKCIQGLSEQQKIDLKIKSFNKDDAAGFFLVIIAIDDINLQKEIYDFYYDKGILINSVDSIDYCSFIFGSIILEGDLVIGINTSSKAPAVSKALKALIKQNLPENLQYLINAVSKTRKTDLAKMHSIIERFFRKKYD